MTNCAIRLNLSGLFRARRRRRWHTEHDPQETHPPTARGPRPVPPLPPPPPPCPGPATIALVVGTRPEIIKLAVLSKHLGERGYLVHSGQHFDENLSEAFFAAFGLAPPELRLDGVGGASRAEQFSRVLGQLGRHFSDRRPDTVVVQGDTNTAAAAAQAAHFAGIRVVHVEAGLRSNDRAMPEEINRMLVGVVADLHCAPTDLAADNLRRAGVDSHSVHVTGNTVVEATLDRLPGPDEAERVLTAYGVEPDRYVLATIHRPENADHAGRLDAILTELAKLPLPVVFPAHPRTRAAARRLGLSAALERLAPVAPVGYGAFLALARHARLLVSDSGGIQEECTVLKKPLIVVRDSTERPEAVESGFAHLVQPGPAIAAAALRLLDDGGLAARLAATPSPYGDGLASRRIAELITASRA
ncbi:MAG TPA: UDP-N-acetylglucosamine 2-epimerase (non-hydrolyzing) [Actinocrinis sp.]|jgi:UDP-N-acetylglucosamine 2-epimerase (non-hydrolysing)|uniref:non-hydrolyzing UDP-N-acetylglucosamine 2-epimerase n=1 Tax=Actinocrinis sp. TaxID=1920516 RepID=UPI002DDD5550|nr:UDP-N-acetylglucosamine 2-epimerase (non-hydrolyzing) [Actinocrinis sp.]HEV3169244.1 UDP-N-acetylglucosamine 2-epimerase (non-hydrolyzing) [Actinocrinis sp.]